MYNIQTICHPTADSKHPLILVNSSQGRYLFGSVGEGSQRVISESSIKLSKLKGVFLTGQLTWSRISGLPGLILTVSDRGVKSILLHYGNILLHHFVASWRYFVFRQGADLKCFSGGFDDETAYKDDTLIVRSFEVDVGDASSASSASAADHSKFLNKVISKMFPLDVPANKPNTEKSLDQDQLAEISISDPNLEDDYINTSLPTSSPNLTTSRLKSTNYLLEFIPQRGKFDPHKAAELGVPKGPLYAQLTRGDHVTLADGTTVSPDQVLGPGRDFAKVLILDASSDFALAKTVEKLRSLAEKYTECFTNLALTYIFLGDSVTAEASKPLLGLLQSLKCSKVVVSHPKSSPNTINFHKNAELTLVLKSISPNCYKLPICSPALSDSTLNGTIPLIQNQSFDLGYDCSLEYTSPTSESPKEYWTKFEQAFDGRLANQIETHGKSFREFVASGNSPTNKIEKYPGTFPSSLKIPTYGLKTTLLLLHFLRRHCQIVTLGTGSAIPSSSRNVSSSVVRVPELDHSSPEPQIRFRSVILDAGENTIGSISRLFTEHEYTDFFENQLKLVYISHLHADHHLGAPSIISEWFRLQKKSDSKLYVVGPWQYEQFLHDVEAAEPAVISNMDRLVFISAEEFLPARSLAQRSNREAVQKLLKHVGLHSFQTVRAHHCKWSYCVSLKFKLLSDFAAKSDFPAENELPAENNLAAENLQYSNKFKISYSGDTRPVRGFIDIGWKSDILIHEATLEDDMLDQAIAKCHSTFSEAFDVGRKMRCRKLVLTHFSQRYPNGVQCANPTTVERSGSDDSDSNSSSYMDIPVNAANLSKSKKLLRTLFSYDGSIWWYGMKQKDSQEVQKEVARIMAEDEEQAKKKQCLKD